MSKATAGEVAARELRSFHDALYMHESELKARLEQIVQATKKLAACRKRSDLNRQLVEVFAYNMAAEGASLFICHEDHLELAHSLEPEHVPLSLQLPLPEESIFHTVLTSKKPLLIRDIERQDSIRPSGWKGYKNGSLLVFPLTDDTGGVVAVLSLHNKKWPPFTQQDLYLGQILGYLCVETLRCIRTKECYKELIENSSGLTGVIAADGTIRYISPSVQKVLGYQPPEMVGTELFFYIHPEDTQRARRLLENGKTDTDRTERSTLRCKHTNGSWRTVSVSVKNAFHIEAVQGFIINAMDVTDHVLAQQQVRRQEQRTFHRANLASLSPLVAGIAHEINNPNNYIRLISQNLQDFWTDIEGILCEKIEGAEELQLAGIPYPMARQMMQKMLAGLLEGSRQIESLIRQLKEYARIDSGDLHQKVYLPQVVESAIMKTRELIDSCTEEFSVHLAENLPWVKGDFHQIEQLLINLLTNSCQSLSDNRQSITVTVETDEAAREVVVQVRDEGIGIPVDQLGRVADPFYTTRREMGAIGLGLSICQRIVQNHGGELFFVSRAGAGTTAQFRIPEGTTSRRE